MSQQVAEAVIVEDASSNILSADDFTIPIFVTGSIRDLIQLRRDEFDSFMRWREYFDEARNTSSLSPNEIVKAVKQGLEEHNDRMHRLKKQGYLGGLSAGLTTAGIGLAAMTGDVISASTALGLGGLATAMLSDRLSQQDKTELEDNPIHFLWLTNRLHNWGG